MGYVALLQKKKNICVFCAEALRRKGLDFRANFEVAEPLREKRKRRKCTEAKQVSLSGLLEVIFFIHLHGAIV